jgi:8-oxo-dGTP diphosphatase
MSDFWEFPGGKLRHGESAAAALQRELAEELGIRVDCFEHFQQLEHRYPDAHVVIDFFLVLKWSGVPEGLDGQNLAWVAALDLDARRLLPADVPVVKALRDAALRQNVVSKR